MLGSSPYQWLKLGSTMVTSQLTDKRPTVSLRTVLISMFALWTVYFFLITARGFLVGMDFDLDLLWRRGVVCLVAVAVTFVLWCIIRLFEGKKTWLMMVVSLFAAMPGAVLIAQVNQMLFQPIQEKMEEKFAQERGLHPPQG